MLLRVARGWAIICALPVAFCTAMLFGDSPHSAKVVLASIDIVLATLVGLRLLWQAHLGQRRFFRDRTEAERTALFAEIEDDLAGQESRPGRLKIGEGWLCYYYGADFWFQRLDNLAWIYTERIVHRLQGVVPYRFAYQLRIWDRWGNGFGASLSKEEARAREALLTGMLPWLAVGFTDAYRESWNRDRPEFIAWVDQGRAQHAENASAERKAALAAALPVTTPFAESVTRFALWLLPFVLLVACGAAYIAYQQIKETHGAELVSQPVPVLTVKSGAARIKTAEAAIRDKLPDPDRAEFRDVRVDNDNDNVVCGLVNAKKRVGGYTGYAGFYVEFSPDDGSVGNAHIDYPPLECLHRDCC
jgi:hypothetical protein